MYPPVLALLSACIDPVVSDGAVGADTGTIRAPIVEVEVTIDPLLPSVAYVSWQALGTGPSWVEWGEASRFDRRAGAERVGDSWRATVVGMPAGAGIQLRAVTTDGSLQHASAVPYALWVDSAPERLGRFEVEYARPESEVARGLIVTHPMAEGRGGVGVFEGTTGRWVWWRETDDEADGVNRARPHDHGLHWMTNRWGRTQDTAMVHTLNWDGSDASGVAVPLAHHDFMYVEGALAYIAFGLHDEVMVEGEPVANFAEDRLVVNGIPVWSALEDLPCAPVWRDTMEEGDFLPGYAEWTHANSLVRVGDLWLMLLRYEDALVAIDDSGETRWILGGRCADARFLEGESWSWPHLSEAWYAPDGLHLLVFDNGTEHPTPLTAAREFVFDENTGVARAVWGVPNPSGAYLHLQGDVRTLPGGNRLIAWSPAGVIEEVTPSGVSVWRAHMTPNVAIGRVHFLDSLERSP